MSEIPRLIGDREIDVERFQAGVAEAHSDIQVNRCRLYIQTRGTWGDLLVRLMRERFGVEVIHISDMTTHAQLSFEAGYNSTIKSFVDEKFGDGAYDSVWREVRDYREATYEAWRLQNQTRSG